MGRVGTARFVDRFGVCGSSGSRSQASSRYRRERGYGRRGSNGADLAASHVAPEIRPKFRLSCYISPGQRAARGSNIVLITSTR